MSTMPLRPDYSPDSDDDYRYGDGPAPLTPEELAEIEADVDALEGVAQYDALLADLADAAEMAREVQSKLADLSAEDIAYIGLPEEADHA